LVLTAMGERIRDYGWSVAGLRRHARVYGALYLLVLPILIGASFSKAFQHTYPFYRGAARSWTDFLIWEGLYGFQFVTLEFFFRVFLLFALRRALGAYSIFVMIVPYCIIHWHKPIAEVLGAIAAGTVLGTLALRARSIWLGVAIHIGVALTMDVLSLLQWHSFPPGR